jgi:hypothetical protein
VSFFPQILLFDVLCTEGPEGVKWELGLGCWDWDLATGNGKWSLQKWEWDWGNSSRFPIFPRLSILKYNFDPFLVSLVMIFVVNYIIHSATSKQAYSGARNSGFSDYACPQVRYTAGYMPGFRYILHLTLSIYLRGKAQPLLPHGGLKGLKIVYSTDK